MQARIAALCQQRVLIQIENLGPLGERCNIFMWGPAPSRERKRIFTHLEGTVTFRRFHTSLGCHTLPVWESRRREERVQSPVIGGAK